ncbi:protein crumbs homolog 1 isoform X1 [Micropterus dolomieu]|uniref:protein crumbs homolog 1 isoform X1 n=1 Tax=Micropterus dolomieu TaxID=147949 RepID=UPI001E8E7759|nr:protein crumbs homolog 1 isoform X1 [Micropterus dolomieu]XP_045905348.1 protein crumbs homolog 1 isoform X1 [Micropterus dolomieu]XP_045905349.1 protein crumbs homolog 1 isoform X1 [Micropterus dolomieu]
MMDLIRYPNFELLACTILISSLFVIYGASPVGDQCSPNPCQNSALCRIRGDGYSCFCVPGFQGAHCQIDVNECVSQPCRNGATCVDRVGSFSCLCSPGFTGATCEVQIDECQSKPCINGGSCHDYVGGFTCTCLPGFQGHRCEINIDQCQEHPCQNGALCIDGVNDYSCDCSHTGFTGRHCETLLPACHSEPCFNSAICKDNRGNYTCECWPGFEGRHCDIDINECGSSPCMHGGRCIERSWQALYGSEALLPEHYDQQHAAGYICSCPLGTKGSLCQEVINQCDPSPCKNGGRCESHVEGYICHCLKQSHDGFLYGGINCDVRLVGCEGHECQNQGSCSPFMLDGTHGYTCSCSHGYTGPLCKTPTTFSFERRGYLLLQSPLVDAEESCNITLSFKTVLPRAMLFQRNSRGLLLILVLDKGQLRLTLRKEASAGAEAESPSQVLELPHNVTDGEWHSVEAVLGNWVLSLKLLDDNGSCGSQSCHRVAPVPSTLAGLASSPQNTFIGGVLQDSTGSSQDSPLPAFMGCMRDVFVDWQLVVPEEWLSNSAANVSPGCSHRDRCLDVPCQNRGQCVNLWQSYQCRCPRPYEGQDCEEEHVTARFGHEDSQSFAAFTVTDDLGHNLFISLFLRTRRHNGLLLVLANSSSQYLHMWLEDGKVTVQVNNFESLKAESAINNGEVHFVSVEMVKDRMALYVAAQIQGDVEIGTVNVQAGDTVYVGGLLESRRTSEFGGYFKGCIQDLRINDRRLQFFGLDTSVRSYPLELMENVTTGCSGDNACSRNPCLNGGMCYSMWDDFTCTCPLRTAGRRCEEVKWCELSPCPTDSECRMLNQGYECYSNATFLNDSTVLSYRGNGQIFRNLTNLSLNLRTRKRNAAILHAEKGSAFITLSVQDGFLFMELQSTTEDYIEEEDGEHRVSVNLSSRISVTDGEWHSVHLFMATPWAQTSRWTLVLDEEIEEASTSRSKGGNLDFLRQGVDIFLGGLAPDAGWSLTGCLSTVELGGIALPYLSSSDVNLPRLQEEQFIQTSLHLPLLGCSGGPVCEPNPCLNGGDCQDLFNTYNCSCADGWAGRRCDFFTDTCASSPCVHGNCSVNGLAYVCTCEFGYAGVDCDEEVDMCINHLCAHGGTCLHGPDRYACLCPENYTGPLCNERVEEIPWYIAVRNVRPKLPVSVCGDDTRNYTCFNGGNCTDRELSCDCPPGFAGHRCEQEVDECKSNPCLNGGYCRNLINKFVCVCDMSFAGDTCQTDTARAPHSSWLAAVLALCLVGLAIAVTLGLALAVAKLREMRQTEGGFSLQQLEAPGGCNPPAELGNTSISTLAVPVERLV